ncbi:ubiquinol oxidase subunit II [soil metagenome]
MPLVKKFRRLVLAGAALLSLGGCDMVLMNPSGHIALQQRDLIIISTILMLLIIVPVMVMTGVFAWRYRHTNAHTEAEYDPDWSHSTGLELLIWSAPLLIIIALGAVTWISTHTLDPYRPLDRIDATRGTTEESRPLVVQVVALDWKWLFFYPEQGIATVNELAAPVDRPIQFKITASSVMNSFFIPALAGQIYAMPGMETQLHAVINKAGVYDGFSANYSGAGFSQMRFKFHGLADADFDKWVDDIKAAGGALDRSGYLALEKPSVAEPIHRYASADAKLYDAILNRCVEPNRMCMKDMMAIDHHGGMGDAGTYNLATNAMSNSRRGDAAAAARSYVGALCTADYPAGAPLTLADGIRP